MTDATDDRTKDELQEELRKRDLPVSGTKQELLERLDDAEEPEADGPSPERAQDGSSPRSRDAVRPRDVVRLAAQQLTELMGRRIDGTSGLRRTDEGWHVQLEVVEVSRTPPSTDLIGSYDVAVDENGELLGYERLARYIRGQAREE